ncbi:PfkB family carbohydrate kinase [Parasulfitobacter algicola]|uniref:Ribokinase n=1 Tax=Parasulfitobacter algicola TaxID=2614809 RepID=A0ABX2J0L4_9RHOB|nr:PfkB family carbohydrate kinase [Sulfitobacter algicola]NSX56649.1 ribokinase [Sulfitobacter algicola]
MTRLLVVGALHWDVIVQAPRLPREDETLKGDRVGYKFGGKGGNQAIAAARAGASVSFAGRIGADEPGREMADILNTAGVDTTALQHGTGASGMSVAIAAKDGSYQAVIVSGENANFDIDAFRFPENCHMVLLQNEMPLHVLRHMIGLAKQANAQVILNAAPADGITPEDMSRVDGLIVNCVEGADLLKTAIGQLDPDTMVTRLQRLCPQARIILTLGGDGVAFAEPMGDVKTAAARCVDVVSTHGAGDVFCGTYAAACLQGVGMSDAINHAQDAAARHITAP